MSFQQRYLQCGRFTVSLQSTLNSVNEAVSRNYHELSGSPEFVDFAIKLVPTRGARRWVKPQARFLCNGLEPFNPLPLNQAYPLLEWGLNWAVTQHFHETLVIHAAVLEKNGKAVILPGLPGAGKSTLCAALAYGGGWRLLSDELTLYDPEYHEVLPNPRPVSLKNQSIDLIAKHFTVPMTPTVHDTLKGSVAHTKPTSDSLHRVMENCPPTHVIFPKFNANLTAKTVRESSSPKSRYFFDIADNSFNYSILRHKGFLAVGKLVSQCDVRNVEYGGDFDSIIEYFETLVNE